MNRKWVGVLIVVIFIVVVGFAYWSGQRAANQFFRPATIVKYLPARTKIATSLANTAETSAGAEQPIAQNTNALEPEVTSDNLTTSGNLDSPADLGFSELTDELVLGLEKLENATEEMVERNINVAEALIERDPDLYLAYKSKLLNLLISEIRFGQDIEVNEYENLYDEMLSFQGVNESDEILAEVQAVGGSEVAIASPELEDIDQDLIHIPFLRYSALNDLESLAEISEEYINDFPESYIGYLYFAESLWKTGDREGAISTLQQGLNLETGDKMVLYLFSVFQQNPLERIYKFSGY